MKKLTRIFRYLILAVLALALFALAAGWWIFGRSLPQLSGELRLPELAREVLIDRDLWGIPYIRAESLEDLVTAHGYVHAQDRLWQMDLIRRVAAGELSEIFGAATLELDRENRTLGLRRAAEQSLSSVDSESRAILEAYARGVNRYITERRGRLPWEFVVLRYTPRPWTPADSALVGGYMYRVLTSTWRAELNRAKVIARVGPERARELFVVDSPLDYFVVGHAPAPASPRARRTDTLALLHSPSLALLSSPAASPVLHALNEEIAALAGSNNWVVDGRHTYSGKPILANDTHLPLDVPSIWHLAHLTAPGWNVKGFALPGLPLIIIGHNERIAWGFTNSGVDVQDLYIETFNPQNPQQYRANGRWADAEVRREVIRVRGQPDETLEIVVTRHGPVIHREGEKVYAVRWVATEPGAMAFAYPFLGRAQNWQEFLEAAWRVPGPSQNVVYADVDGNIGYVMTGQVPVRRRGDGSVPVPGDDDGYEWTGYIPAAEMPRVLNPPDGLIATANARIAGPAYPHFLTDRWEAPYRTARIVALLKEKKRMRPQDSLRIQADVVSLPNLFLSAELLKASQRAAAKDSRAQELVRRLDGWDGAARAESVETAFLEFTRRSLFRAVLQPHLGEEASHYQWRRGQIFLQDLLRERPAHWLPAGIADYEVLLMAAADEAARELALQSGSQNVADWRWGRFVRLEMLHPLGRSPWLRRWLGVSGVEQHGTAFTVKQTTRSFGPAMLFVADSARWDNSWMCTTLGQSGQWSSRHSRDQFPAWFAGRSLPSAFTDDARQKVRRHQLRLLPGAP